MTGTRLLAVALLGLVALGCGGVTIQVPATPGGPVSVGVTPAGSVAPSSAAPTATIAASGGSQAATWSGQGTFECGGGQRFTLENQTITVASGDGIWAAGDCQLVLKNCTVRAPTALDAGGMADVTVIGGVLEGATDAVYAAGEAKVHLQGVDVRGPIDRGGDAVVDQSGTSASGSPASSGTTSSGTTSSGTTSSRTSGRRPTHARPPAHPRPSAAVTVTENDDGCEDIYTSCTSLASSDYDECTPQCDDGDGCGEACERCLQMCEDTYATAVASCESVYESCAN